MDLDTIIRYMILDYPDEDIEGQDNSLFNKYSKIAVAGLIFDIIIKLKENNYLDIGIWDISDIEREIRKNPNKRRKDILGDLLAGYLRAINESNYKKRKKL